MIVSFQDKLRAGTIYKYIKLVKVSHTMVAHLTLEQSQLKWTILALTRIGRTGIASLGVTLVPTGQTYASRLWVLDNLTFVSPIPVATIVAETILLGWLTVTHNYLLRDIPQEQFI